MICTVVIKVVHTTSYHITMTLSSFATPLSCISLLRGHASHSLRGHPNHVHAKHVQAVAMDDTASTGNAQVWDAGSSISMVSSQACSAPGMAASTPNSQKQATRSTTNLAWVPMEPNTSAVQDTLVPSPTSLLSHIQPGVAAALQQQAAVPLVSRGSMQPGGDTRIVAASPQQDTAALITPEQSQVLMGAGIAVVSSTPQFGSQSGNTQTAPFPDQGVLASDIASQGAQTTSSAGPQHGPPGPSPAAGRAINFYVPYRLLTPLQPPKSQQPARHSIAVQQKMMLHMAGLGPAPTHDERHSSPQQALPWNMTLPHVCNRGVNEGAPEGLRSTLYGQVQNSGSTRPPLQANPAAQHPPSGPIFPPLTSTHTPPASASKDIPQCTAAAQHSSHSKTADQQPQLQEPKPSGGNVAVGAECSKLTTARHMQPSGLVERLGENSRRGLPQAANLTALLQPPLALDGAADDQGCLAPLEHSLSFCRVTPQRERSRAARLPEALVPFAVFFHHPAAGPCQSFSSAFAVAARTVIAKAQLQCKRVHATHGSGKMVAMDKDSQAALCRLRCFRIAYYTAVNDRYCKGSSACHAAALAADAAERGAPEPKPPSPRLKPSPVQHRRLKQPQQQWIYSVHAPTPLGDGDSVVQSCSSSQKRRRIMGKVGRA
jgi:hypothetical protein